MKTFITRALSAIVFAAIMIFATYYSEKTFVLLLILIAAGCSIEWMRLFKQSFSVKWIRVCYTVCITLINMVLASVLYYRTVYLVYALPACFVLLISVCCLEFLSDEGEFIKRLGILFGAVFFIGIPLLSMYLASFQKLSADAMAYNPWKILCPVVLVWVNDSFAYISGTLIGKHPLAKKISPKKTIEGLIGGGLFTIFAAFVFYFYGKFSFYSFTEWLVIGAIVFLFGTLGDLMESKIKRSLQIKDSGSILPGHGGFLDRFDAMLFVMPPVAILNIVCSIH